jgi:hypothetical protein
MGRIRKAAADTQAWMAAHTGDPLDLFRQIKFDMIGFHPVDGHVLNLVEQINQTWTYVVALAAARKLLELHPDAGGYRLAPGANASIPLDIMSEVKKKGSNPLFAFCECFFNPPNSSVKLLLFRYSLLHQQIGRARR